MPIVGSVVTVGTLSSQLVPWDAPDDNPETSDALADESDVKELPPDNSHDVSPTGIIDPVGVPLWDVQSVPLTRMVVDVVPVFWSVSDCVVLVAPGERLP